MPCCLITQYISIWTEEYNVKIGSYTGLLSVRNPASLRSSLPGEVGDVTCLSIFSPEHGLLTDSSASRCGYLHRHGDQDGSELSVQVPKEICCGKVRPLPCCHLLAITGPRRCSSALAGPTAFSGDPQYPGKPKHPRGTHSVLRGPTAFSWNPEHPWGTYSILRGPTVSSGNPQHS